MGKYRARTEQVYSQLTDGGSLACDVETWRGQGASWRRCAELIEHDTEGAVQVSYETLRSWYRREREVAA